MAACNSSSSNSPEKRNFWAALTGATSTAAGRLRSGLQWEHNLKYNNKINLKSPACIFKKTKHHRSIKASLYYLSIGFQDDSRTNPFTVPIDVVLSMGCHNIPGFFESSIAPLRNYLPAHLYQKLIEQWTSQHVLNEPYDVSPAEAVLKV